MDCQRFLDVLDGYIDGELPRETMGAAEGHRRRCPACARAVSDVEAIRLKVRQLGHAERCPADVEGRVRQALREAAGGPVSPHRRPRWQLAAAAAFVLAVGGGLAVPGSPWMRGQLVSVLDRAVLNLAATESVVVEATILCRDCELQARYGTQADCDRIGHHGALATRDGRLWTIVEREATADLIHNEAWLGRKVRIRGRFFRDSGSIAIESYQAL